MTPKQPIELRHDNPFSKDCEKGPNFLNTKDIMFFLVMVFVTLMSAPFLSSQNLGADNANLVSCGILALYAIFFALRVKKIGSAIFLILVGMMLYSAYSNALLPTVAVSLILGIPVLSSAICLTRGKEKFIYVIPVAFAFGASYMLSGMNGVFSVLTIVAPAILCAVFTLRNKSRISTVCAMSAGFIIASALLAAYVFYTEVGPITADSVRSFLESTKNQITDSVIKLIAEQAKEVGTPAVIDDDTLKVLIGSIFNILPALVVVTSNILMFVSQSFQPSIFKNSNNFGIVTVESIDIMLSPASAVVFIICGIASLIAGTESEMTLASAVFDNIAVILEPGLVLCGFTFSLALAMSKRAFSILPILILGIGFMNISIAVSVFSILGAGGIIYTNIAKAVIEKRRKENDGDGNGDSEDKE